MERTEAAASMLAHDDEGRARDLGRIDPEADRDAAREDRLSSSELAGECEDVVRSRCTPEALAEPFGVERRMADEVERRYPAIFITHSPLRGGTCGPRELAGW